MLDLATRAHNHSYRIDPIVRSLLDTDFYKFLMLQFIWLHYRAVPVTFSLINRTTAVRLADVIPEQELREQLDHARSIRVTKSELIWLAGNTFYGQAGMFRPDFLTWLAAYQLPAYHLAVKDGQYELTFSGPWAETTLWEIPALAVVNTLRNRQGLQRLSRFELDVLYAQAKTNLWRNLVHLRDAGVSGLADFGTRRRHDYLFHEWAVLAARDVLGPAFTGTSNVLLAMRHDIEAIGTHGHELPMVQATMARTPDALRTSQYDVLARWQETYGGRLLIFLPDTYGTTQFLAQAQRRHVPRMLPKSHPVDAMVPVDRYLPGCPPTPELFMAALDETGSFKPAGTVCQECGRRKEREIRPTHLSGFLQGEVQPEICLINQGYLCIGASTRGGCRALCTKPGHPCVGCRGPSNAFIEKESAAWLASITKVFTNMTDIPAEEIDAALHSPQYAMFVFQFSDYDEYNRSPRPKEKVL